MGLAGRKQGWGRWMPVSIAAHLKKWGLEGEAEAGVGPDG